MTRSRFSETEIHSLASAYSLRTPQDILQWAFDEFGARVALCTSFQAEGMAMLDMAWRMTPSVRVFTIDTGRLPQETYALLDQVREQYGIEVEVYCPDTAQVEDLMRRHGANLFYHSESLRLRCCHTRKVLPLRRVLTSLEAWATGLRREQSLTRAAICPLEVDHTNGGLVKVNPLANWTEEEVWAYVRRHQIPVHPLYAQGFTSIGCAPCTRPPLPGEDPRAGRWWWERDTPKECGMHCSQESGVRERRHDILRTPPRPHPQTKGHSPQHEDPQ